MGVRQVRLDRPFARAGADQSAVPERFQRAVDLVAVAGRGIEEAVDAAGDVREQEVGADQPEHPKGDAADHQDHRQARSEEHTSELQSLMRISYAVFCLKKKKHTTKNTTLIQ